MIHERNDSETESRHRLVLRDNLERLSQGSQLWTTDQETVVESRRSDAVRAAVDTVLTAKQREVVEAYFFEGLSQGEIARQLGVTQQVVQKRLFGARRGSRVVGGALQRLRIALSPLVSP
jgi:RNA polymerase sigma factor (sigma-70 family)